MREPRSILPTSIIADTPEARRLAEALNRLGGQMMTAIDGALHTRTAPPEAQRARHLARGKLVEASMHAMIALGHAQGEEPQGEPGNG